MVFYLQRYFVLSNGILKQVKRENFSRPVDLGLSEISVDRPRCRIDIDTRGFIYRIKVRHKKNVFLYSVKVMVVNILRFSYNLQKSLIDGWML